jgi:uncharacterized membrane protein YvbJ
LLPFTNKMLETTMFCPNCGRENKDNALFCAYCKKALPSKKPQLTTQTNVKPQKGSKIRISNNAIRAVITGILIIVLIIIVLQFYYPGVLPWN